MRLPKYIKIYPEKASQLKQPLCFFIHIKKWGIPIIVFKALREYKAPWYKWVVFPSVCVKMIRGCLT